ncbi:hypothetical protein P152DRAFT_461663 [Eremomyces bilateralis CBS 781.70]|uniref:Uncharacterized protein n=1 Tax=Eremomyces bilateralis CBS 781.70 TaxID=1392243 RepID=A0A6G1FU21_9PEZI|nr:uncharacterized protein P152DRAFT_461663 [Eremomyces bilateralis CBS 781.70]KAF1809240.1 hypothetical protein P152DRAFT_461663 [Eremomyces bilateralis CBS 781.70]
MQVVTQPIAFPSGYSSDIVREQPNPPIPLVTSKEISSASLPPPRSLHPQPFNLDVRCALAQILLCAPVFPWTPSPPQPSAAPPPAVGLKWSQHYRTACRVGSLPTIVREDSRPSRPSAIAARSASGRSRSVRLGSIEVCCSIPRSKDHVSLKGTLLLALGEGFGTRELAPFPSPSTGFGIWLGEALPVGKARGCDVKRESAVL